MVTVPRPETRRRNVSSSSRRGRGRGSWSTAWRRAPDSCRVARRPLRGPGAHIWSIWQAAWPARRPVVSAPRDPGDLQYLAWPHSFRSSGTTGPGRLPPPGSPGLTTRQEHSWFLVVSWPCQVAHTLAQAGSPASRGCAPRPAAALQSSLGHRPAAAAWRATGAAAIRVQVTKCPRVPAARRGAVQHRRVNTQVTFDSNL